MQRQAYRKSSLIDFSPLFATVICERRLIPYHILCMFCKTCASKYSPKCGYDSKYVYDCSGFGEALKTKEKCTTTCYTYRKGGGCTGDPCVCWKKGDTCGYTFPLHCDLLNHTLYECEAAGKPPKYVGKDCLSDQTCTTYSQENDQCTTTNTCKSTTKESTCSQEYQPECVRFETNVNGTFNTYGFNLQATVDQNSKAEICPFGCSGGVCSDCECKENMTRCGYTYPRSCNLDYHRMYKCEIGKKPKESGSCGKEGCVPGFNRTAEDGSTITGPLNDTCLNNCLCRSANNVSVISFFRRHVVRETYLMANHTMCYVLLLGLWTWIPCKLQTGSGYVIHMQRHR